MRIEFKKEEKRKNQFSLEEILKKEITLFGCSFTNKHKEKFYGELSVLLISGIDLSKALILAAESFSSRKQKDLIEELNKMIVVGASISDAMASLKVFSEYEIKTLEIGEQTGKIGKVTGDLASYYQKRNDQKREIISAITYPAIVMITAIFVVFFMLKYVVPMFKDIFEQNRVELPFLTKMVVSLSDLLQENGFFILMGFIFLVIIWKSVHQKIWFKKCFETLLLKIPLAGRYVQKIYLTKFSHTMMLLAGSRIPIASALLITHDIITFYPLKNSIALIGEDVKDGEKLSQAFKHHSIFENKIISLLVVAEETNKTEYVFQKLYDQYSRDLELQAKNLTNIINPILTILVGFLVGIILIAMYLPMFKLSNIIG